MFIRGAPPVHYASGATQLAAVKLRGEVAEGAVRAKLEAEDAEAGDPLYSSSPHG